ncbi:MAG: hypothetical protein ACOC4M_12765 [Promethearchaeia archaeon]
MKYEILDEYPGYRVYPNGMILDETSKKFVKRNKTKGVYYVKLNGKNISVTELVTNAFLKEQYVIAPPKKDRKKGNKYILRGEIRIWNGKIWHCEHNRIRNKCKECGGTSICEHNRIRSACKECGGASICEHNRQRNKCKECGGASICEHNRERNACKECGGSSICEHNRIRYQCKECGGASICEHNRKRSVCKKCGGSSICEHNRRRNRCKECGGASICEHNRQRSACKTCGGASICEHNRQRNRCKTCGGASICEHNRERNKCKECNPNGYLASLMRGRVYSALKYYSEPKKKRTMEYVGCDIETLRKHIEKQFQEGMNWKNQGKWHIDHRRPCASFDLNLEKERHKCFHYTNLQPLWGEDNLSKNDFYDEEKFEYKWMGEKWIK